MDARSILVGTIIGLLIGMGVGYGFTSSQMSGFQTQISSLQSQVSTLMTQADKVPGLNQQIETLTEEKSILQNQIANLQNQTTSLNNDKTSLQNQITSLNNQIASLNSTIEELRYRINLVNAPASKLVAFQDLNLNLTTDFTTYSYKEPLTGDVIVTYLNGTGFTGYFTLSIRHEESGNMATTGAAQFGISNGVGPFAIQPTLAFIRGSGNYTVILHSIYNAEGYLIIGSGELDSLITVKVIAN